MSYAVKHKGPTYHWVRELFAKMGFPEMDGVENIVHKENEERIRRLEKKKSEKVKKQRVNFKQKCQQEQKRR